MMRYALLRRAFTLVETVIVVGLSAIMMVMLGFLIYTFNKTSSYEQTSSQSAGSASAVTRDIESLVFPADAVLQTHTFASGTYTSSSTALVLELPSFDSSGTVITNTYDYAVFYIVGTNVYRLLEANAASKRVSGTKKLSSTVNALTFTYNNVDFTKVSVVIIDVQTQATVKPYNLTSTDHQHEQVTLRNH